MEQRDMPSVMTTEFAVIEPNINDETVPRPNRWVRAAVFAGKTTARLAICAVGGLSGGIAGGGNAYTTQTHVEITDGIEIGVKPVLGNTTRISVGPVSEFPDYSKISPDILASAPVRIHPNEPAGNLDAPKIHTKLPLIGIIGAHAYVSGQGIHIAQINSKKLGNSLGNPLELIENPIVATLEGRLKADFLEGSLIGGVAGMATQGLWAFKKSQLLRNPENHTRTARMQKAMLGSLAVISIAEGLGTIHIVKGSRISPPSCRVAFMPELIKQYPNLLSSLEGSSVNCGSDMAGLNEIVSRAVHEQNYIDAFYKKLENNLLIALASWHDRPDTQANLYGTNTVVAVGEGGFHCAIYGLKDIRPLILGEANARIELLSGNISVSASSTPPLQNECATFAVEGLKSAEQATGHVITPVMSAGTHDYSSVLDQLVKNGFVILNNKPQTIDGITIDGQATPHINKWGETTKINLSAIPTKELTKLSLPAKPNSATVPVDISDKHNIPEISFYWSGEKLASSACSANTNSSNFHVLVTNSPEQEYQAAYNGCANFVLSGEGPAYDINYVSPTGQKVFRAVQISAGGNGADCNLWFDETVDHAGAQYAVYSFNQQNHTIHYANIMLHADASVMISPWQNAADAPLSQGNVDSFLALGGDIPAQTKHNSNPNAC